MDMQQFARRAGAYVAAFTTMGGLGIPAASAQTTPVNTHSPEMAMSGGEKTPPLPILTGVIAQTGQNFYNALPADGKKYVDDALVQLKAAMKASNGNEQEFYRAFLKIMLVNMRDEIAHRDANNYDSIASNRDQAIGLMLIAASADPTYGVWAAKANLLNDMFAGNDNGLSAQASQVRDIRVKMDDNDKRYLSDKWLYSEADDLFDRAFSGKVNEFSTRASKWMEKMKITSISQLSAFYKAQFDDYNPNALDQQILRKTASVLDRVSLKNLVAVHTPAAP